MAKYLLKRILRGAVSVVLVVGIVMVLVYSFLDRELIFANDPLFSRQSSNAKQVYMQQQWERYGYVDYVPYADYLLQLLREGQIDSQTYADAVQFGDTPEQDSEGVARFVERFRQAYEKAGYRIVRLPGDRRGASKKYKEGGEPRLFATRDIPLPLRLWNYLTGLIRIDNIHYVQEDIGDRGLTFTLYDPAYGGERFSPAVMGNGTEHKYLLYFDDRFPYLHQNLVTIRLGQSYSVTKGVDVFDTMTDSQGAYVYATRHYPSGLVQESADDLHSAKYVPGSYAGGTAVVKSSFTDDYTAVTTHKSGLSKVGYSFTIGIIAVGISYLLAVPLGIFMALRKDGLGDKLGTAYIVFITAVPALAYIFLFKALGGRLGLPTTFDMEAPSPLMYVLPIASLALPAVANLMKWLRRYMIDQMHADYVKFARSGGLSEEEIFTGHVLKNAIIPIVHGIPAGILGALVGAIITERVYVVPGAGNLLTEAINAYDNGAIVGVTLFYAVLSVASVILGDVLISLADPRISFTPKER